MKKNLIIKLLLFCINFMMLTTVQAVPTRLAIFAGSEDINSCAMARGLKKIIDNEAAHVIVSKSILQSNFRQLNSIVSFDQYDCYHVPVTTYFLLISNKRANQDSFKIAALTKKPDHLSLQDFIEDKGDTSLLSDALPLIFYTAIDKAASNSIKKESIDLVRSEMQPLNIIFNGHGFIDELIAGLKIDDFNNALSFFNTQVATSLIVIISCFAAGVNQQYMEFYKQSSNNAIKPLNLKYSLVIQGMQQATTSSYISEYNLFFKSLEASKPLAQAIKHIVANDEWFLEHNGLNTIPQLLVPNVGWRPLIDNIQYITNITKVKLATAYQENKSYNLKNVLAGVLESNKITTGLEITPCKPKKNNFSMGSLELRQQFPTYGNIQFKNNKLDTKAFLIYDVPCFPILISLKETQLFKEIKLDESAQQGIFAFIRNGFFNIQERAQRRVFFIASLTGLNDIVATLQGMRFVKYLKKNSIKLNNATKENWDAFLIKDKTTQLEQELGNAPSIVLQDVFINISEGGCCGKSSRLISILFTYNGKKYECTESLTATQSTPVWEFIENDNPYDDIYNDHPNLADDIAFIKNYSPDNQPQLSNFLIAKQATVLARTDNDIIIHFVQQDLIKLQQNLTLLQNKLQQLKKSLSDLLHTLRIPYL